MGLFDMLARKPMTAKELSVSAKLYPPAVNAWCAGALAYGLIISKASGSLQLRRKMAQFLIEKSNPNYLGGQFSYLALRSLEYGAMEDLFRRGEVRSMSTGTFAVDEATHWDHYAFLRAVPQNKRLEKLLAGGCMVADIGCGSGSLITKLCDRYPKSEYYGIDPLREAVVAARKALRGRPATIDRGKAEYMRFREKFDVVYLGESLYAASQKEKVVLNCWRSLKRGGMIAVVEGLVPSRIAGPDDLLIMGMQMDFALQGHAFMSKKELSTLLNRAGFKAIAFRPLGGSVYLAIASKS